MTTDLSPAENRITAGIDHLLRAAGAWTTAADATERRTRTAIGRLIGGTTAAGFAGGVAYGLGPVAWSVSGALLALSVWVAGAPADTDTESADDIDPAAFLELVHDVAGGANVHLVAVREQLAEETGREWSGPEARALCDAAAIPVRDGVRVPGARPAVTTGIHRDDLPPLPQPLSEGAVGVVGAGHDPNNNTNTPTTEEIAEGVVIVKHGPSIRQGVRR